LLRVNTYRPMYEFARASEASDADETAEKGAMAELTKLRKVVFCSTLEAPLSWANTQLVSGDAVAAVFGLGAMPKIPISRRCRWTANS
jgi:hypothetical protein